MTPEEVSDDIINDLKAKALNPIIFGEAVEKNIPEVLAPVKLA